MAHHVGVFDLADIDYAEKALSLSENPLPGPGQQAQRALDLEYLQMVLQRDIEAQQDGASWISSVTINPEMYLLFNRVVFDWIMHDDDWVWDIMNSGSPRAGCTGDPNRAAKWSSDFHLAVPPTPAYRIRRTQNTTNISRRGHQFNKSKF